MSETAIKRQLLEDGFPVLLAEVEPKANYMKARILWVQTWVPDDEGTWIPDETELLIDGSLKWDGCANLQLGEEGGHLLHFCGRAHARIVDRAIGFLYDLGAELIPGWQGEG